MRSIRMRRCACLVAALVLGACLVAAPPLRAESGAELRAALLAATLRAIDLEITAAGQRLKAAEAGTGPQENVERFRQKIRDLETERARFAAMAPEEYPAPVEKPSESGSVLESSASSGPVLPPLLRRVTLEADGPCADSPCADDALLAVRGTSKSGPFYHLAGIAGGDYGILKRGKAQRLELCLVYRREYFGFIGDYYVYVRSVR